MSPSAPPDPVRILALADLHLGRRASRLPADVNPRPYSAAAAWKLAVERALAGGVDAVLLGGDVVDRENRFFEAFGPLEEGVRRLSEAGIPVVAVAGNHDHDALRELEAPGSGRGLRLIGSGGRWERATLERDGRPFLHVDGWSFPRGTVPADPTGAYPFEPPDDGLPLVGLLHGDLGNRESPYAPLDPVRLASLPPPLWVLGHLHAHREESRAGTRMVYPGSPMALDPGERGRHGGLTATLTPAGVRELEFLPLSRIRYEEVPVPLGGVESASTARSRIAGAVADAARDAEEEGGGVLELLSCRIRLTGRTPLHGDLAGVLAEVGDLDHRSGDVHARVEGATDDTVPDRDLEALARGDDPPALVARLLLSLQEGSPAEGDAGEVLREAREVVEGTRAISHYAPVRHRLPGADREDREEPDHPEAVARRLLERQGYHLLEALLTRHGPAPGREGPASGRNGPASRQDGPAPGQDGPAPGRDGPSSGREETSG